MSINSMAELTATKRVRSTIAEAQAAGIAGPGSTPTPTPTPATAVSNALKLITAYIPTEIITLYVAYRAVIHDPDPAKYNFQAEWNGVYIFLLATPLAVWVLHAIKLISAKSDEPLPIWPPNKWPFWT